MLPRRCACLLVMSAGCALQLAAIPAYAQAVDEGDGEEYAAPPTERRGGFMASLSYDLGYGVVGGYPNKLGQIDNPAFYREVSGFDAGFGLVLGGALRDWLTAGLLVRLAGVQQFDSDSELLAASSTIGLRVEGYPLYGRSGAWRDVGIAGEFGVGLGSVVDAEDRDDVQVLADGGAMSHLGLGVTYTPWRFWLFSAGPEVRYVYQYSQSLTAHLATVGMRLSFFGVQPD